MIILVFGNVGSGKTASMVRMMKLNPHKKFLTNINVKGKGFEHVQKLDAKMIFKRVVIKVKKNGEEVTKLKLNVEFWKDLIKKEKHMNLVIDESHIFFNPRRSMSDINLIMGEFLSLLRRVLGSNDQTGTLYLITQLSRKLDVLAREMANQIIFTIHHYYLNCKKCEFKWKENNETSNKFERCPNCNYPHLNRSNSLIEVYKFTNVNKFLYFKERGERTYYQHYLINDIETIFENYDTLQFDDFLSGY